MRNLSNVKGILLDFENTLIKFETDWEMLRKDLSAIFLDYGIEIYMRPLHAKLVKGLQLMKKKGYTRSEIELAHSKLFKAIDKFEEQASKNCVVFDDAKWFLEFLSSKKISAAILTNNMFATVKRVFNKSGIDFKGMVIGRDEVKMPKPGLEGARKFINKFRLNPADCLVIGDSDYDMEIARSLGCFFIFLKRFPETVLNYTKPDLTITSLRQLKDSFA